MLLERLGRKMRSSSEVGSEKISVQSSAQIARKGGGATTVQDCNEHACPSRDFIWPLIEERCHSPRERDAKVEHSFTSLDFCFFYLPLRAARRFPSPPSPPLLTLSLSLSLSIPPFLLFSFHLFFPSLCPILRATVLASPISRLFSVSSSVSRPLSAAPLLENRYLKQ